MPGYMRERIAEIAGDRPELLREWLQKFRLEFSVEMFFLTEIMEDVIRAAKLEVLVAAVCHLLHGDEDDEPIVCSKEKPIVIENDK